MAKPNSTDRTRTRTTEITRSLLPWLIGITVLTLLWLAASGNLFGEEKKEMKYNKLTPKEERVIVHKGTEPAFTGEYYKHKADGTYLCKRCDAPLFESSDKFDSGCGWPSFDDAIEGAVKEQVDADGRRTEIICANCGGHLGHVFRGEGFTPKNTRHCVNSISINFATAEDESTTTTTVAAKEERAYFAGGCFWGTEYLLEEAEGVISARSGYMGGHVDNPDYNQVCSGTTGHAETVEVVYDPSKTDFETLARLFFEIHDPTQKNRQGPDVGTQYRSAVFYADENQKATTERLIGILRDKGYDVTTEVAPASEFWPAEEYHQDYYAGNGHTPYCHGYQKRF